jgi:hypothetical protein
VTFGREAFARLLTARGGTRFPESRRVILVNGTGHPEAPDHQIA